MLAKNGIKRMKMRLCSRVRWVRSLGLRSCKPCLSLVSAASAFAACCLVWDPVAWVGWRRYPGSQAVAACRELSAHHPPRREHASGEKVSRNTRTQDDLHKAGHSDGA